MTALYYTYSLPHTRPPDDTVQDLSSSKSTPSTLHTGIITTTNALSSTKSMVSSIRRGITNTQPPASRLLSHCRGQLIATTFQ